MKPKMSYSTTYGKGYESCSGDRIFQLQVICNIILVSGLLYSDKTFIDLIK